MIEGTFIGNKSNIPESEAWMILLDNVEMTNIKSMIELRDSATKSIKKTEEYALLVDVINQGGLDGYLEKSMRESSEVVVSLSAVAYDEPVQLMYAIM